MNRILSRESSIDDHGRLMPSHLVPSTCMANYTSNRWYIINIRHGDAYLLYRLVRTTCVLNLGGKLRAALLNVPTPQPRGSLKKL